MTSKHDERTLQLEKNIHEARHVSKPKAENTTVVRDCNGRWLFEIYPGKPAMKDEC